MKTFLILIIIPILTFSQRVFISPTPNCSTQCSGAISQPFDNLWSALNESQSFGNDITILLLKNTNSFHYLIDPYANTNQMIPNPNGVGTINKYISILVLAKNITIRPLYCDELEAISNLDLCVPRGQSLEIFLKSDNFNFIIDGSLTIENIVMNGLEDITKWNSLSNDLLSCLTNNIRCCDGVNSNSTLYP